MEEESKNSVIIVCYENEANVLSRKNYTVSKTEIGSTFCIRT